MKRLLFCEKSLFYRISATLFYTGYLLANLFGEINSDYPPLTLTNLYQTFGANTVVEFNRHTGTPHRILIHKPIITRGKPVQSAEKMAREFVQQFPQIYQLTPDDLKLEVLEQVGHLTYVIFRQTFQKIPVYQSKIDFRFHTNGHLVMTGIDVYSGINLNVVPNIDKELALQKARLETDFIDVNGDQVINGPQLYIYVVEDDVFSFYLAWRIRLHVHHDDPTQYERAISFYEVWVDAHNGEIIALFDRVEESPISGTIAGTVKDVPYGIPTERPFKHVQVVVEGVGVTHTDENGFYSIEAGTVQRNVTVEFAGYFIDIDARNVPDALITTSVAPGDTFNVIFNDFNSISAERETYFQGNFVHDWILSLDTNFTGANYSMPAAVNIGSEDPLWPCNAYWDGVGINMFSAGGGCSATGEMADVIYHEYQHGLTQFAYAPFASPYESGMGEGFSDYTAMTIRNSPCMGDAFFGTPGQCLRHGENMRQWPAPECDGEVHCLGEISMGALWKMRQNLIASIGDSNIAVSHSDTLFRWALVGRPFTIPDLLLEILLVDDDDGTLLNGTPNFAAITEAFAQHNVMSPIPEYGIEYTPVGNTTNTTDPVLVEAVISSIHGEITLANLIYIFHGDTIVLEMTSQSNSFYQAHLPPHPTGTIVEYYLHAVDQVGNEMYSPAEAPTITHFYLVGLLEAFPANFTDDCEIEMGWQLGVPSDNAATGIWERVEPIGTHENDVPVQPEEDHTENGIMCFVTGNAPFDGTNSGLNDVDDGRTTLLSPVFDLRGTVHPILTYWRWYTNNLGYSPAQDVWLVQITSDGINWVDLENTVESSNSWTYKQFLLRQYIALTDSVQVRFIAEDTDNGSLVEAALDDIMILNGIPFEYIAGDMNFDSQIGIIDILMLVDLMLSESNPTGIQLVVGDMNQDGTLNILDMLMLINTILFNE